LSYKFLFYLSDEEIFLENYEISALKEETKREISALKEEIKRERDRDNDDCVF
jgi:hypothetical protein